MTRWLLALSAVGIGAAVVYALSRVKRPEYLSERWVKAQSYSRQGQGWWV